MTAHNPTPQQMHALTRIYAVPGEHYHNDIPTSVFGTCAAAGWIRQDDLGQWWITPEGQEVFEVRRQME